mgnify:CR=1 FL=1
MEKVKEYKYYSTQRPVNIGTFPQNKGNRPIRLENYTGRTWVELNTRLAWGEVVYAKPLSDEEQRSYELMPSRNNPNVRKKMDAQAWVVGKWEDKNHVRYPKRLTWFYPDFGCYQVKEYVSPEQLAECARKAGKQDAEVEGIQNAPLLCGYIRRGLGCQTAESATEQKGHICQYCSESLSREKV